MRAAFCTRQGSAREVLQIAEQPIPGPGEVRVKLATSGANPSDWKSRGGARGAGMSAPLIIPHSDGAGVIDAVGLGVPDRVGERVWIWNGQWKRPFGKAAKYIALPAERAVHLPDNAEFAEGTCLGIPAFTAMQSIRLARLEQGSTVLVVGGAGSVGHYAIQLAKRRGARVLTTVSNAVKAEHARKAGADETINYRVENVGDRIGALTRGKGVDVVIDLDLTTNAKDYPSLLKPHGAVVVYGMSANETTLPSLWLMRNSITLRLFLIYDISDADRRAGIVELTKLLGGGQLVHTIARRLPLDEITAAHQLGERGSLIGNAALDIA